MSWAFSQKEFEQKGIRFMKRLIAAVCVFFSCSCLFWGCQKPEREHNAEDLPELVIGLDGSYEPYTYVNENGEMAGSDIELAEEACKRMGMKPVFRAIKWDDKEKKLESGEIDCIWSCYTMTGREEQYLWAGPYMHSRQVAVVRDDSEIQTLDDLTGKNVAVMSSTKPEGIFLKHEEPHIPIVENVYCLENLELAFAALQKNYVDATAGHEIAVRQYIGMTPGRYRILDKCLMSAAVGVAFYKHGDADMAKLLNSTLQEMQNDGTIGDILEDYGIDTKNADGGGTFEEP